MQKEKKKKVGAHCNKLAWFYVTNNKDTILK